MIPLLSSGILTKLLVPCRFSVLREHSPLFLIELYQHVLTLEMERTATPQQCKKTTDHFTLKKEVVLSIADYVSLIRTRSSSEFVGKHSSLKRHVDFSRGRTPLTRVRTHFRSDRRCILLLKRANLSMSRTSIPLHTLQRLWTTADTQRGRCKLVFCVKGGDVVESRKVEKVGSRMDAIDGKGGGGGRSRSRPRCVLTLGGSSASAARL